MIFHFMFTWYTQIFVSLWRLFKKMLVMKMMGRIIYFEG